MATNPTWTRFTKMWKTIVYPVIEKNIEVEHVDHYTFDEEYEVVTKADIDTNLIYNLINQIQAALETKGYVVSNWKNKLTIEGRDEYDPIIDISIYEIEYDDDVYLYDWDDTRWADWDEPKDEFGFNLSYSTWIKEHGIKDTYDDIGKAPKNVQKSYCEYCRATDYNRLGVSIIYAE